MKHLLLVGQRDSVLDVVVRHPSVQLRFCIAISGSHLERQARQRGLDLAVVDVRQKDVAVDLMMKMEFDVLLSVGCPWLLPIATLRQRHRHATFLNVHPSCLPRLRGAHPLNGAILFDEPYIGASVHIMAEEFDTGAIIAQRCIERTPDLDLPLLYAVSRLLEADVVRHALDILVESNGTIIGTPQQGTPTYYTRRWSDMECDARNASSQELIRRVRAFGVPTQGCRVRTAKGTVIALDAAPILNNYLLQRYASASAGDIVLECDGFILVRTCDGLVKLSQIRWIESAIYSSSCAPQ